MEQQNFETTIDRKDVKLVTIQNGKNLKAAISNYGARLINLHYQDVNVIVSFDKLEDYFVSPVFYHGATIGRYGNRIRNGEFKLNGQIYTLPVNNGPNHLHGGVEGLHQKIWDVQDFIEEAERTGVVFRYVSNDGEEGYPGNLQVTVSYSLNQRNELCIEYSAETDKPTPVNLTNHSYFNLSGFAVPVINDHLLQVNAAFYTEKNEQNVPTGSVLPVADTALDFQKPKRIGIGIDSFPQDMGYDHNFVLQKHAPGEVVVAAKLYEPLSGRLLTVSTSQPGIQVYTANYWDGTVKGVQGCFYQKHAAVALETQAFSDSPNQPSFPNTILVPGETFSSKTIYAVDVA